MAASQAAIRDAGTRQNTWVIRFKVADKDMGIWDKKSGGEVDSEELKYNPGGMNPPISLGGSINVGNITISRIYDRVDDGDKIKTLINGAGKSTAEVSQRAMDLDGHEVGDAIVYLGILKRVTIPDTDSEANDAAMVECEITVGAPPGTSGPAS